MRKLTILIFVLVLLVLIGCTSKISSQNQLNSNGIDGPEPSADPVSSNPNIAVKEFTIHSSSFSFSPSEIRVKVGDRVKINYISDDIGHNLVIDELNLRTDIISDGETDTIEFTADRAGNFDMYCSVGQHRDLGMEGQLIVEA